MSYYSRSSSRTADCKLYVGDLGTGAAKGELERAFSYYGPLRSVWVARNPPGFAFVEYEDPRDAEDAVRGMDGKVICGSRVRVELSNGMSRRSRFGRGPGRRRFDPQDRCYQCGERGHYAYDCYRYSKRRRSSRSRSRSRSRGRRYSRSRSRSRDRSRSPSYNSYNKEADLHLQHDQEHQHGGLHLRQDHGQELLHGAVIQDPDRGLHLNKQAVHQAPRKVQVQIKRNNAENMKEFTTVNFLDDLDVGAFSVHAFQSSAEKPTVLNFPECFWSRKPSPVCKFIFFILYA
ncbi:serine/arginine-rich splicing factor 7-like isoform X2 [Protopterus annectens]|uniref:serine/arginine-rich splicing factor 7-like isoform X2 n=1 Tax=Protopterus annectens TaxID=7888 RepID=UPI001CFAE24A|nr:serine/arginine-rich splicing factor 7-like isoform X2 [Protopterus annectens]